MGEGVVRQVEFAIHPLPSLIENRFQPVPSEQSNISGSIAFAGEVPPKELNWGLFIHHQFLMV
jgi:hypothetical protein